MTLERVLAAVMVVAALGTARLEAGTPLAARVRDGRPWLAWLEARERGAAQPPSLHLLVYDPVWRRLIVLHAPGNMKVDGKRTLDRVYLSALKATGDLDAAAAAAEDLAETRLRELSPEPVPTTTGRLAVEIAPLAEEDEASVVAARELKVRARRPRVWLSLARRAFQGLRAGDRAAFEPLLFALETRRVSVADLRPVRLPDDALAPALLGRLLAVDAPPDAHATTVEVLNGTGVPGLASHAVKMLRFRGVDVLSTANVGARERTLVYDRVGDFRRAAETLKALGCRPARAVTRVDPSRVVDVSVALGADCADAFGTGASREP